MNYNETGFRPFYHQFTAIELNDTLKAAAQEFPGADGANFLLTYGYIDEQCGLTLEILATAMKAGSRFYFAEGNRKVRSFIRIETVQQERFYLIPDTDGELAKRYADKIWHVHRYDAPQEIEKTRRMTFLDGCRHKECVDDIRVYMIKSGMKPEQCWTRITGLGDYWIEGTLLNEPYQDYGCHKGDTIRVFAQETNRKEMICFSNLDLKF